MQYFFRFEDYVRKKIICKDSWFSLQVVFQRKTELKKIICWLRVFFHVTFSSWPLLCFFYVRSLLDYYCTNYDLSIRTCPMMHCSCGHGQYHSFVVCSRASVSSIHLLDLLSYSTSVEAEVNFVSGSTTSYLPTIYTIEIKKLPFLLQNQLPYIITSSSFICTISYFVVKLCTELFKKTIYRWEGLTHSRM